MTLVIDVEDILEDEVDAWVGEQVKVVGKVVVVEAIDEDNKLTLYRALILLFNLLLLNSCNKFCDDQYKRSFHHVMFKYALLLGCWNMH